MVRAEHAELGVARLHASLQLVEAPLVDGTEGLDLHRASPSIVVARDTGRTRTAIDALCRRVPRPFGHGVGRAAETLERIRTSARGVEARCSSRLSYEGRGGRLGSARLGWVTDHGCSSRVLRRQKRPLFRQQRLKAPARAARAESLPSRSVSSLSPPFTARSPRLTLVSDGKPRRACSSAQKENSSSLRFLAIVCASFHCYRGRCC